ncbi:peptidoglycan recognition protein family protein [Lysinibacillus fusiformis]|uniref:peptidoglycan recognition protein family protein n=1 Tax=Lysinibacillus fusiformis TaxID=28031 RepID=UPI00351DFD84
MVSIRQNLVPPNKYAIKCPYEMNPEFITIHNTANDASAKNEILYMVNNNNQVSYHFAVDDIEVIQGLPLNRNAWHCGDGQGNGNRKSIGIEICYSKSGGVKYIKAEENAVCLTAKLLYDRKWGIERVKKHQDWNGKYCPHRILDNKSWGSFLNRVQNELSKLNSNISIKPPITNDERDDNTMKFTNETTKAAVRNHLKQTIDKNLIDKSWLDKFDNGTMTVGDYEGLKLIIAQRS